MAASKRVDPAFRTPDMAAGGGKLKGADRNRHYVYVDPGNDTGYGVGDYEAMGYRQELRTEGGVRVVGSSSGDSASVLSYRHQILMSISLEEKAQLDQHGPDGNSGQAYIDKLEKKMIKPGGIDGFRGFQGGQVLNEGGREHDITVRG